MAKLTFLGAAGTVTGSRHLLEIEGKKLLIDCGLFQGRKEDRLRNWEDFPVPPSEIDRVFLTHAHIDHTGWLPRLVKGGFSGPVHSTDTTFDLSKIMLKDSAHLQEEDAKWANKRGYSKHKPALPLYTVEDAERALELVQPLYYGEEYYDVLPHYRVKFKDAGHILGSSFIEFKKEDGRQSRKILFSGDFGRPDQPVLRTPTQVFNVDYLVLESTYGDRLHGDEDTDGELIRIINEGYQRNGVIVIPSFAVGRTQTMLYKIRTFEEKKLIPDLQVFIDSPMAIETVDVFKNHLADMDLFARVEFIGGKELFKTKRLHVCKSREDSIAINDVKKGAIIISSSGMVEGGRILHHMAARLPDPSTTVLFIGYQAIGTRGRKILEGSETIKIHGQEVPIKARIESVHGTSGHGDYNEILAWLMAFNKAPERIFIVHGEGGSSEAMAQKIRDRFGWDVVVPKLFDSVELDF
ncbi:MBL fold metallo-hydrolase [candidate division KSB1 bacterium]|nr:MBL fold metallo-hydrolase [candidate division KSB1 bacterium]RQW09291.1 MAG: MBL fold metallo-hydrolase [candidate division KSB1 bacterium]